VPLQDGTAGVVTLRALRARGMLKCAQRGCFCFRSLPRLWVQRTIGAFSVAQSPSSARPGRGVLSAGCLWKAGARPRHYTLVVRGFSIQRKQISGTAWGKKPRPSTAHGCPRGLGGLVKQGPGFERAMADQLLLCLAVPPGLGRPPHGVGSRPAAVAPEVGPGAGGVQESTGQAIQPQPHPGEAPVLKWKSVSLTNTGEPVLSDPEAGTLTCSACLPSI